MQYSIGSLEFVFFIKLPTVPQNKLVICYSLNSDLYLKNYVYVYIANLNVNNAQFFIFVFFIGFGNVLWGRKCIW